jgi:hypothetical protein
MQLTTRDQERIVRWRSCEKRARLFVRGFPGDIATETPYLEE